MKYILKIFGYEGERSSSRVGEYVTRWSYFEEFEDVELCHGMTDFESSFEDGSRTEHHQHHCPKMLPLGEFL